MPMPVTDRYDYQSAGYDRFMKRKTPGDTTLEQQTGDESSYSIRHLSGTSITSGISKSSDGKLYVDWNKTRLVANDGARNRVEIGKIEGTNQYGIRIYDEDGDLVISAGGELQGVVIDTLSVDKLTSGSLSAVATIGTGTTGSITIDGLNNRIVVNDGTNDRVLIGYHAGGF